MKKNETKTFEGRIIGVESYSVDLETGSGVVTFESLDGATVYTTRLSGDELQAAKEAYADGATIQLTGVPIKEQKQVLVIPTGFHAAPPVDEQDEDEEEEEPPKKKPTTKRETKPAKKATTRKRPTK